MSQSISDVIAPNKMASLGRSFARYGWIGFWLQVVFGSLPILVLIYYVAFSSSHSVSIEGITVVGYLTIVDLFFLLITLIWSYRYTRIANRIRDPQLCPPASKVRKLVWTGLAASSTGMFFSMLVMLVEAGTMLFYFLKSPQGGIPVVQTSASGAPYWVSSVDMVSLIALILMLFAELMVMIFSLWLLFRTILCTVPFADHAETAAAAG